MVPRAHRRLPPRHAPPYDDLGYPVFEALQYKAPQAISPRKKDGALPPYHVPVSQPNCSVRTGLFNSSKSQHCHCHLSLSEIVYLYQRNPTRYTNTKKLIACWVKCRAPHEVSLKEYDTCFTNFFEESFGMGSTIYFRGSSHEEL